MKRYFSSALAVLCGVLIAGAPMVVAVGTTGAATKGASAWLMMDEQLDQLILRNGKVIEGRIIRETAEEVRMEVIVAGIRAPATYKKADILQIVRGDSPAEEGEQAAEGAGADAKDESPQVSASPDAPSVYLIKLEGVFGTDISETPVREAVEAAKKEQPDFLIVYLNNDWSYFGGEIPSDFQVNFDWFMVAEKIVPIFTREIDLGWEKQPHLVFWVRNAMGGAAFLPFVADEIYMHPEGRIGGIGTLEQMFEGVGDEVVRQKQRSLRLGMAQGLAIAGGYDYRLITAMARRSYVACYDGLGNLYERMPENPNEKVLTDDGEGKNADTMRQLVSGEGDDVLTLKPKSALLLDVSSGTARDLDELLEHLGILRNHVMIKGRSTQIMERWRKNVARAERAIPRLWEEYNEVPVGGNAREQRQGISRRISLLEEMKDLFRRYGEAFNPFGGGIPQINQYDLMIEELKIQLMLIED